MKTILITATILFTLSCKKKSPEPSPEPVPEVKTATTVTVTGFNDAILLSAFGPTVIGNHTYVKFADKLDTVFNTVYLNNTLSKSFYYTNNRTGAIGIYTGSSTVTINAYIGDELKLVCTYKPYKTYDSSDKAYFTDGWIKWNDKSFHEGTRNASSPPYTFEGFVRTTTVSIN
jgi:hypothetical protein